MKKITFNIAILLSLCSNAYSQQNSLTTAYQLLTMRVSDMMEFTFASTGTSTGNIVAMPFNSLTDYQNGVSSPEQVLRIRSNNKFGVEVKASSNYFDYSGAMSPAPSMPVNEVLNMQISSNVTGGNLQPPFSPGKFVSISGNNKTILNNCLFGDQHFSIKYKAAPGISYPVGNYSVDVIYTATQQ